MSCILFDGQSLSPSHGNTIDPTLSRGMRHLNGVYTQSFNRRHSRVGHVFQGRYVVLNPVKAKMVEKPEQWNWSSYHATSTGAIKPEWLTTDWILGQFDQKMMKARKGYQSFVEKGISKKFLPWEDLKGQIFYGSKEFLRSMKETKADDKSIKEVPKVQRYADRVKLEDLFQNMKDKPGRNEIIWIAYTQYGYKMKEIADFLSIHYTTVSKIINHTKK